MASLDPHKSGLEIRMWRIVFCLFDSLHLSQQFFSHVGTGPPGFNTLSKPGSIFQNTNLSDLSLVGTCDIFVYR